MANMPTPGTNLNKAFGVKGGEGAPPDKGAEPTPEDKPVASATPAEGTPAEPAAPVAEPVEGKPAAEATPAEPGEKDPYADWTKDDFVNEMKKARGEAAKNRVEKKEALTTLEKEYEQRLQSIEEKFKPLADKAMELDKLKEKEADKKRSMEEKISHREAELEKLTEQIKSVEEKYREEKVALQAEVDKAKATATAYEEYWEKELEKELSEVPQKFRATADLIVKGAGNVQTALEEIRAARNNNLFGTKSTKVFNNTPGAKEGARLDQGKVEKEKRSKMTSRQKIGEGLKAWTAANKK